jgi:hypothetical protein
MADVALAYQGTRHVFHILNCAINDRAHRFEMVSGIMLCSIVGIFQSTLNLCTICH